jgi:hypothetical protein
MAQEIRVLKESKTNAGQAGALYRSNGYIQQIIA